MVRFLTRRFLTEFAETDEIDYERTITLDDRQVSLRITDVSGKVGNDGICISFFLFCNLFPFSVFLSRALLFQKKGTEHDKGKVTKVV